MTVTVDATGTYTINSIELIALQDDFDFKPANSIATVANNIQLIPALDPYGLIPENTNGNTTGIEIHYSGSGLSNSLILWINCSFKHAFFTLIRMISPRKVKL
jgi:hypothetical protein